MSLLMSFMLDFTYGTKMTHILLRILTMCCVRSYPYARGVHWQLLTYGVEGEGELKMAYPNFFS